LHPQYLPFPAPILIKEQNSSLILASSTKCFEAYGPKVLCSSSSILLLTTSCFYWEPKHLFSLLITDETPLPALPGGRRARGEALAPGPQPPAAGSERGHRAVLAAPSPRLLSRQHRCRVTGGSGRVTTQARQMVGVKEWRAPPLLSKPKEKLSAIAFPPAPLLPAPSEFLYFCPKHISASKSARERCNDLHVTGGETEARSSHHSSAGSWQVMSPEPAAVVSRAGGTSSSGASASATGWGRGALGGKPETQVPSPPPVLSYGWRHESSPADYAGIVTKNGSFPRLLALPASKGDGNTARTAVLQC